MLMCELVYYVAFTFKMTEWVEQQICIQFCIELEHSSVETIYMIQKAIATGDWQLQYDNMLTCESHLMQSFLVKHQITQMTQPPLQPRFGALQLLAFPKTKITFAREEISDHWWKYNRAAEGNWENCLWFSQGAYFEGNWGIIVLCSMFLVSYIFFNKCLYFS